MMRMPEYLRKFAKAYDLETWVKEECPLADYFVCAHGIATWADKRNWEEADASDEILKTAVAQIIHRDGALEDYVLEREEQVDFHDLSKEGAMTPVCEASAFLVVRRYRNDIKNGKWHPPETEQEDGGEG